MLGICIGIVVLIVVGWAIIKGKYAPLILFASGIFMLACSIFLDTGSFMPKKALPTGNDYLNIVEFLRYSLQLYESCHRAPDPFFEQNEGGVLIPHFSTKKSRMQL